jgi:nucleotide sugar dehydrogenase
MSRSFKKKKSAVPVTKEKTKKMTSYVVGVIGNGFVGKATQLLGKSPDVTILVYDINPEKCIPANITLQDLCAKCQFIFVCVPTPLNIDTNRCDTSIVRRVVSSIKSISESVGIIVRSTVTPGTCEELQVCHMPEYLTERNWPNDFVATKTWELGIPTETKFDFNHLALTLQGILTSCVRHNLLVSDNLVLNHSNVTETAKYMRNVLLAVRVGVCNEFEAFCRAKGIDYEDVRKLVTSDPRIGSAHTQVPGPDGKRGFGGTCLPKDLKAITTEMMLAGAPPMILMATSNRNDLIDRTAKDWMSDRSISSTKN